MTCKKCGGKLSKPAECEHCGPQNGPRVWTLLALLLAGCATPLAPEHRAAVHALWASEFGGAAADAPAVTVAAMGWNTVGTDGAGRMRSAAARYFCGDKAIILEAAAPEWASAPMQSILVHELAHHRQCLDGKMLWMRGCGLEIEATEIQIAWLRKQPWTQRNEDAGKHLAALADGYKRGELCRP